MNSKAVLVYRCGKCNKMYYTNKRAEECCTNPKKDENSEETNFNLEYKNIEYCNGEAKVLIEVSQEIENI